VEDLLTLTEAELPVALRWQAVSFVRVAWPEIDGGALRATYPPALDPVHHLVVDDGMLLASADTFVQVLEVAGALVRVGCLGNVFTFPGARRRGHGSRVVGAATQHLRASGVEVGALLCDAGLAGFYAAAGWEGAPGPTLVDGADGGPPSRVEALRMVLATPAGGPELAAAARDEPLRVPFPW